MSPLSNISTTALVHCYLRLISLSSIPIIPHLFHLRCHHPPVSLLQSSPHHFPSSPLSSPTFFSHGPVFHSALLVPRWLLGSFFLLQADIMLSLWSDILCPCHCSLSTPLQSAWYTPIHLVFTIFLHSASIGSACSPQIYLILSSHSISSLLILLIHSCPSLISLLCAAFSDQIGSIWLVLTSSALPFSLLDLLISLKITYH